MKSILAAAILFSSAPALAAGHQCPTEQQREQLTTFRDRIASADSPEAARELALSQTRLGHVAIHRASKIFGDRELAAEDQQLSAFEDGVAHADNQAEVAQRFDALMGSHMGGCSYDGVEIALIVIGFILGIIPGILFLFLFC